MGNKTKKKMPKRKRLEFLRTKIAAIRQETKRKRLEQNEENATTAESTVALPNVEFNDDDVEAGPSTSFKDWASTHSSVGGLTELETGNCDVTMRQQSPETPIRTTTEGQPSSFRQWIATQVSSNAGDDNPESIEPIESVVVPTEPVNSAEPAFIALQLVNSDDVTDIAIKEETIIQPSDMNHEIDTLATTSQQIDNTNIEENDDNGMIPIKHLKKMRTSKRTIKERKLFQADPRPRPRSNCGMTQMFPPVTRPHVTIPTLRKNMKHASTTTQDLIISKDEGTSTDDIVRVKEEIDEDADLKRFLDLCDRFLDEPTADLAKIRATTLSKSNWLIVTE